MAGTVMVGYNAILAPWEHAGMMNPFRTTFTQAELEEHHERLKQAGVPEQDFSMRIDREGRWFHKGTVIQRTALVRTMASLLVRLDDGGYWLVNPAEHGRIDVEDAPFIASRMTVSGEGSGQVVRFATNLDEECILDGDHPLAVREGARVGEPRPYIRVRGRLDARIDRQGFYDLVDLSVERDGVAGVWSSGEFFALSAQVDDAA